MSYSVRKQQLWESALRCTEQLVTKGQELRIHSKNHRTLVWQSKRKCGLSKLFQHTTVKKCKLKYYIAFQHGSTFSATSPTMGSSVSFICYFHKDRHACILSESSCRKVTRKPVHLTLLSYTLEGTWAAGEAHAVSRLALDTQQADTDTALDGGWDQPA